MDFETLAKKRASLRKYSNKKPPIETIMKIIEVGNLSPSPGNLPVVKYLLIEDKEKIQKISEACRQRFIEDAPYLLIVCSDPKDINRMYDKRSGKYIKQHVGAVIENMLLYITDIGLASCWVGAYSDLTIRNVLGIPEEIEIEAILPVGYPSKIDKTTQKRKPSLLRRIFFERWGNPFLEPFKKIET